MLGFATIVGSLLFVNHKPLLSGIEWLINSAFGLIHRLPQLRKRPSNVLNLTFFDRGVVLRAYLFSLTKFGCTAGRLVLFAFALSVPISPALIILGTPIGQLSYLFAFTPGGLGIFEAGWFAILKIGGVTTAHALVFVVGQRIFTVILIGIVATFSQILYMLRLYYSRLSAD